MSNKSTGNWSTGDGSTGDRSTGNRSTGHWSTGHRSTGHRSTGDWSTGDWSTSNWSTGHFSTIDHSGFGAFNKFCTPEEWNQAEKPGFIFFETMEWTELGLLTKEEGKEPARTTGGTLKTIDYKESWKRAWKKASPQDKELLFALPNFDAEVFKELSGLDVRQKRKVTWEEVYDKFGEEVAVV